MIVSLNCMRIVVLSWDFGHFDVVTMCPWVHVTQNAEIVVNALMHSAFCLFINDGAISQASTVVNAGGVIFPSACLSIAQRRHANRRAVRDSLLVRPIFMHVAA